MELGTRMGLWKTVLNSEVVLFLGSISVYWIGLETEVAALNSHVVAISQVALNKVSLYILNYRSIISLKHLNL